MFGMNTSTQLEQDGPSSGVDDFNRLMTAIYDDLRQMCARFAAGERPGHTLQKTALVHEVFLRLREGTSHEWESRAHILAAAATATRRILTDYARARRRLKRGGGKTRVSWELADVSAALGDEGFYLDLFEALEELSKLNPKHAKVFEMRFMIRMTDEEMAEVLGVTDRTVREWLGISRAWLANKLS
jgi:RNA polymerase sigma factor (TIGR02999 family)